MSIRLPPLGYSAQIKESKLNQIYLSEDVLVFLENIFKACNKHLGAPFGMCLQNVRLAKAREAMKNTPYSISEIAYMCGFTSLSTFSKVFKEKYCDTLTTFRKRAFGRDYSALNAMDTINCYNYRHTHPCNNCHPGKANEYKLRKSPTAAGCFSGFFQKN